jgi:hypothetical protein
MKRTVRKVIIVNLFFLPFLLCQSATNLFAGGVGDFFNDVLKEVGKTQTEQAEYQTVAFFKTIQIEFQEELLNKNLKTSAIFNRIENVPKSGPGVSGYINLRLCDPKQKNVCDDLFLIDKSQFDQVYALNEGEPIVIYGTIKPKPGFFGGHFYIFKIEKANQGTVK